MTSIAIRITDEFSNVNLTELFELCGKVAVYQHNADATVKRTHIHILLQECDRKYDTIRTKFMKGKFEYSMKQKQKDGRPVDDGYIAYMSKGQFDPVYVKGYDPELIAQRKKEGYSPTVTEVKAIDGKLVRTVDEKAKKTKRELIEIMRSKYVEHMPDTEILKMIRKVLTQNNEVIGMYKVLDFYDALLMYSDKTRWIEMMASKINSRIRI